MRVSYRFTTVDDLDHKKLFCGRANDLTELINYISQSNSVALFGERRIGKSLLLYLLRDIINGEIKEYQEQLLDQEFKNAIEAFRNKISHCKAIYINLQELGSYNITAFLKILFQKIKYTIPELLHSEEIFEYQEKSNSSTSLSLQKFFQLIHSNLNENEQLAILIDEVEVFLKFTISKQIFDNIRSIIQAFPRCSFILAGSVEWHKQIKEKTSPLVNNVYTFYLKAISRYPAETYLIQNPLCEYFPVADIDNITQVIINWTGCKPYYIQAVCQIVVEHYQNQDYLSHDWKDFVEREVQEEISQTLDYFYSNEHTDDLSKKILALLANKPCLTESKMARLLGYTEKAIRNKTSDLKALDKIREKEGEFRIVGTLIERWGKKTLDIPQMKNPYTKWLRWLSAILLLALYIGIQMYIHPENKRFLVTFPPIGELSIQLPVSLEVSENGTAKLSFTNISRSKIDSIYVTLSSKEMNYELNNTNRFSFESVFPNESKILQPTFMGFSDFGGKYFSTIVRVSDEDDSIIKEQLIKITKRAIPVKQFMTWIHLIFIPFLGFLVKPDLSKLIDLLIENLKKMGSK